MDGATKNDEHELFAAAWGILALLGEDLGTCCQHRGGKDKPSPGHIKSNPFLAPRMDFWALGTLLNLGCASLLIPSC